MKDGIKTVVQQRLFVLMFFAMAVMAGVISFLHIPIDAFPDLTNNQVQVLTEAPGYTPIQTEELVTIPIESMMNGLPYVSEIRSLSKFGVSVITIVFEDGVDTYFARQLVSERLQAAKGRLPNDAMPELGPISAAMGEIYQYIIQGEGYSATELKTLNDWQVRYQLRTVPGVNEVNSWGGYTLEYKVNVNPASLIRYKLTLDDVFTALKQENTIFSGGIINQGAEQVIVRGEGLFTTLQDIEKVLVSYVEGTPVYIGNIADVEYGQALRQGAITQNGKGEAVIGIAMMLKGENSRSVIQRVTQKLHTIQASLPEGVKISPFYNQTSLINHTLETVRNNLLEGSLLVIAILLLFLGNLRAALIVAITIPISLMFSFIGMNALGVSASIMSLGALDFGMIVDGSIVMAEDILRRLGHQKSTLTNTMPIVLESVRTMARPIFFGVLIITVVYAPILSLQGMEYRMFSPMVFTVIFALIGSLLVALFLVPVLCSFFLKGRVQEREHALLKWMKPRYLAMLSRVLATPKPLVIVASLVFIVAAGSLPFMGTEFVPELDEGDIIVTATNLPSTSVPEAVDASTRAEKVLLTFPQVENVVTKIGRPDLATDPMGVYQSDMFVALKPKHTWNNISKDALIAAINTRLSNDAPGASYSFTQPIAMRVDELVSGVKSDVAIKLFGDDLTVLKQKGAEIEALITPLRGARDVQVEQLAGNQELVITPDRNAMARYGVRLQDIREIVQTAIIGTPVSEIIDGRKRFTLRVGFPEGINTSLADVNKLLIYTPDHQQLPLNQVAHIRLQEGVEAVNREDSQRRTSIQFNVRSRDVGSLVKEAQALIASRVQLPPGYTLKWGGQFENQQRATKRLMVVIPLAILVIFLLLLATFGSVPHALLVLLNVPFALIGGVAALWLRGLYLSVPAAIGFIALFGVAILNGLVLVSTINQLRTEGLGIKEAVLQGAESRLRPVLITALVAMLGFLPMAVSTGSGAEVQRPLATVVIGGLLSATLLTLFLLPTLYSLFASNKQATQAKQ